MWGFVTHPGVEPAKNAAEQALRTIVLERKIFGPTLSQRGDQFIARGFSAFEACRRQGQDPVGYLHGAVVTRFDKTTSPSLLPALAPAG